MKKIILFQFVLLFLFILLLTSCRGESRNLIVDLQLIPLCDKSQMTDADFENIKHIIINNGSYNTKVSIDKDTYLVNAVFKDVNDSDKIEILQKITKIKRTYFQEVKNIPEDFEPLSTIYRSQDSMLKLKKYIKFGNPIINSLEIKNVWENRNNETNKSTIYFKLSQSGTKKFKTATERLSKEKRILGIFLGESLISAPNVKDTIDDGIARITGYNTASGVITINSIKMGCVPFEIKVLSSKIETIKR